MLPLHCTIMYEFSEQVIKRWKPSWFISLQRNIVVYSVYFLRANTIFAKLAVKCWPFLFFFFSPSTLRAYRRSKPATLFGSSSSRDLYYGWLTAKACDHVVDQWRRAAGLHSSGEDVVFSLKNVMLPVSFNQWYRISYLYISDSCFNEIHNNVFLSKQKIIIIAVHPAVARLGIYIIVSLNRQVVRARFDPHCALAIHSWKEWQTISGRCGVTIQMKPVLEAGYVRLCGTVKRWISVSAID